MKASNLKVLIYSKGHLLTLDLMLEAVPYSSANILDTREICTVNIGVRNCDFHAIKFISQIFRRYLHMLGHQAG